MGIAWLLERMAGQSSEPAFIRGGDITSYGEMLQAVISEERRLAELGVTRGAVVALDGDFSAEAIATFLALANRDAIVVPLTKAAVAPLDEVLDAAGVELVLHADRAEPLRLRAQSGRAHPLVSALRLAERPGLVLFSSGTTGRSKAVLHDLVRLLEKHEMRRPRLRALAFLLFDHIGGMNTMLHTFAQGAALVAVAARDPDTVCEAIARHRVELLPASPSFLRLLLLVEAHLRHDLGSLRRVTYGTEVMPEATLLRLRALLPGVTLQQTYGLSELGILRTASKDSGSLLVRVGGEGVETKVVDGTFRIRSCSAMLGYLNAPTPFDDEGWLDTQDRVEVHGEYVRFLGRASQVINVGGQKVDPCEVENALLELDNVRDATVFGEPHPITGQVVSARVALDRAESPREFRRRMRERLHTRLPAHQIPVKVEIVEEAVLHPRGKKARGSGEDFPDRKN